MHGEESFQQLIVAQLVTKFSVILRSAVRGEDEVSPSYKAIGNVIILYNECMHLMRYEEKVPG